MPCLRCARDIEPDSAYCRFCGAAVVPPSLPGTRRLVRLPAAASLGGVCAGLAAYFDIDVTLVRLAWVILSIVPGGLFGGVAVYLVAWIVIPPESGAALMSTRRRLHRSATDVQIAGVCAGIAEYFNADPTVVRLLWVLLTIVPGAIVLGVFAYAVAWAVIPRASAPPLQPAPSVP